MQLYEIQNKGNRYCGPAVISAIAGVTTAEAAALIRRQSRDERSAVKGTYDHEVSRALHSLGFGMARFSYPLNSEAAHRRVNLRRWAKDFARSDDVYLVAAGHHWILVQGRHAMCGKTINLVAVPDHPHARTFVTKAYRITKQRTVDAARVVPKPTRDASESSARAKVKKLAALHEFELERLHRNEAFPLAIWPHFADDTQDPHPGDHYLDSWSEALVRVNEYIAALEAAGKAKPGTSPKAETEALAAQFGISVEQDDHGNRTIWVHPPEPDNPDADPYADAHHVDTWPEALARVQEYITILTA